MRGCCEEILQINSSDDGKAVGIRRDICRGKSLEDATHEEEFVRESVVADKVHHVRKRVAGLDGELSCDDVVIGSRGLVFQLMDQVIPISAQVYIYSY